MPVPAGFIPDTPSELSGFSPDVAYGARQNLKKIKSGADIPKNSPLAQGDDTRGFWHSLLNATPMPGGGGIPTNNQEAGQMLLHQLVPGYGTFQQISSLVHDPSFQNINRNFNPMAAPLEQMGSGNVAGGLGSATPLLAASLLSLPKSRPQTVQPGLAPSVNMLSPRPTGPQPVEPVPVSYEAPTPAGGPIRQVLGNMAEWVLPKKLTDTFSPLLGKEGTKTVTSKVPLMPTELPKSVRMPKSQFPMQPTNGPIQAPPVSRGSMPLRDMGEARLIGNAAQLSVKPASIGPTGTDFPMRPVGMGELPSSEQPQGSPPLRPIGDWFRPVPEAVYGDAPQQPFIQPKKVGPEYNLPSVMQKRFEPGDQSGPVPSPQLQMLNQMLSKLQPKQLQTMQELMHTLFNSQQGDEAAAGGANAWLKDAKTKRK